MVECLPGSIMELVSAPDDDAMFVGVPEQCIVTIGDRIYVRESEAEALIAYLRLEHGARGLH